MISAITSHLQRSNILFIMADQMVPHLTGAYGHPVVRTPNLNRLVEEGIRFDAAYSPCPVCAPARAALMTGRYVSRIGAYDNASPFSCEEPTFAHYLTLAGYDTVLAGKMHFMCLVPPPPRAFLAAQGPVGPVRRGGDRGSGVP